LPLAWAGPSGSTDELIAATVAANEVAGRVGLAGSLGRGPGEVDLRPLRAGAAVMRARMERASAAAMTSAVEAALESSAPVPLGEVATAAGAARIAGEILGGGGVGGANPARLEAWGGAGKVWFTRTLACPRFPGSPGANVALDALDVILGRHLKAAEKRLRADQVERVDVRVSFAAAVCAKATEGLSPPALGAWSLAEALSLLLVHHELGPEWLESGASGEKAEEVAALASRVTITTDWKLSARRLRVLAQALGPVLGPVGVAKLLRSARPHLGGELDPDQLVPLFRERPWEALTGLRKRGGLEACDLVAARCYPAEVKLYTTRGGWWPERRNTPTGIAEGLESAARGRFGNEAAAESLLAARGDKPAGEWVAELRA